jgi:hypothetical protein
MLPNVKFVYKPHAILMTLFTEREMYDLLFGLGPVDIKFNYHSFVYIRNQLRSHRLCAVNTPRAHSHRAWMHACRMTDTCQKEAHRTIKRLPTAVSCIIAVIMNIKAYTGRHFRCLRNWKLVQDCPVQRPFCVSCICMPTLFWFDRSTPNRLLWNLLYRLIN